MFIKNNRILKIFLFCRCFLRDFKGIQISNAPLISNLKIHSETDNETLNSIFLRELAMNSLCNVYKSLRWSGVWIRDDNWNAFVAGYSYFGINRHFSKERYVSFLSLVAPAAIAKNFHPFSRWSDKITHIFNYA